MYGIDKDLLFGVSSGLLSLVGLIAIFVSINTQHNVEKAREVLWALQSFYFDNKEISDNSHSKITWYYNHYRDLTQTRFNLSRLVVILLACFTIAFVAASWIYYTFRNDYTFKVKAFIFISCLILFMFIALLLWLTMVPKVGSLPTHKQLFDIEFYNEKISKNRIAELYGINMQKLFIQHIKCKMDGMVIRWRDGCPMMYTIQFKLPYTINYSRIELTFYGKRENGNSRYYGIKDPKVTGNLISFGWNSEYQLNESELNQLEQHFVEQNYNRFGHIMWPFNYIILTIDGMHITYYISDGKRKYEEGNTTVFNAFVCYYEGYTKRYNFNEDDRNSNVNWIENEEIDEFDEI